VTKLAGVTVGAMRRSRVVGKEIQNRCPKMMTDYGHGAREGMERGQGSMS
jgi:hypothetical protein